MEWMIRGLNNSRTYSLKT